VVSLGHGEFLGREIERVDAGPFVVTFRESGSDKRDSVPHVHETPSLLLALDEGYWSEADGFDEGSPCQMFYTPARTMHRDSMMRLGGRYLCISIEAAVVAGTEWDARHAIALHMPNAMRAAHAIALLMLQGGASKLLVEDACLGLIRDASPRSMSRQRPRWLSEAVEFCQSRFAEPFSIADLAQVIGVHPVHLTRVFRNWYGVPLSKYILSLRVERAAAALRAGEVSIAAVAVNSGFFDQSHFNRAFKSAMGTAPSVYRSIYTSKMCNPNVSVST
jgi:AraC family transcriptional regulator